MDSQPALASDPPYCGPRGVGMLECLSAAGQGGALPAWPHFVGRQVFPTHRARTGLWLLADLAAIQPGDELLAPGYNCGSEIAPFVRRGINVRLYRVDSAGRIDLQHAAERMSRRTRAMLVVHYFGWPQPLREVVSFCAAHGLLLIEDCALALFSESDGGPVGTAGDAAVFSFPKTLSVPDGGALACRNAPWATSARLRRPRWREVGRRMLPLWKARVLGVSARIGMHRPTRWLSAALFGQRRSDIESVDRPDMPSDYYFDERLAGLDVSRITAGILRRVAPERVRSARRRNYTRLSELLAGVPEIRPLFGGLPPGVCPLVFPLLVDDRRTWLAALHARGVPAIGWWAGFHRGLLWDEVPEACELKSRVIALPVHHEMRFDAVDYVGNTVRQLGCLLHT